MKKGQLPKYKVLAPIEYTGTFSDLLREIYKHRSSAASYSRLCATIGAYSQFPCQVIEIFIEKDGEFLQADGCALRFWGRKGLDRTFHELEYSNPEISIDHFKYYLSQEGGDVFDQWAREQINFLTDKGKDEEALRGLPTREFSYHKKNKSILWQRYSKRKAKLDNFRTNGISHYALRSLVTYEGMVHPDRLRGRRLYNGYHQPLITPEGTPVGILRLMNLHDPETRCLKCTKEQVKELEVLGSTLALVLQKDAMTKRATLASEQSLTSMADKEKIALRNFPDSAAAAVLLPAFSGLDAEEKERFFEAVDMTKSVWERGQIFTMAIHGPSGTGKNTYANMFVNALGLPPPVHADVRGESPITFHSSMFGQAEKVLGDNPRIDGKITKAHKKGTALVIDELARQGEKVSVSGESLGRLNTFYCGTKPGFYYPQGGDKELMALPFIGIHLSYSWDEKSIPEEGLRNRMNEEIPLKLFEHRTRDAVLELVMETAKICKSLGWPWSDEQIEEVCELLREKGEERGFHELHNGVKALVNNHPKWLEKIKKKKKGGS